MNKYFLLQFSFSFISMYLFLFICLMMMMICNVVYILYCVWSNHQLKFYVQILALYDPSEII